MSKSDDLHGEDYEGLLLPSNMDSNGFTPESRVKETVEPLPRIGLSLSWKPGTAKRHYALATISGTGQLPIKSVWTLIGSPREVLMVADAEDPGVALIDADRVRRDGPKYARHRISVGGVDQQSVRVFLNAQAMAALALERGDQVLMGVVFPFLVLLNPGWLEPWSHWDYFANRFREPQQ